MKWIRAYPWLDTSHQPAILLTFIILSNESVSEGEYCFLFFLHSSPCTQATMILFIILFIYLLFLFFFISVSSCVVAQVAGTFHQRSMRIEIMITMLLTVWLKFVNYWRVCMIIDRESRWMVGEMIAWEVCSSRCCAILASSVAQTFHSIQFVLRWLV